MKTTQEIVVLGEDFIERRIILAPGQTEIALIQQAAYKCGWRRGFFWGLISIYTMVTL
jgi:hypothetical protein